MKTSELIGPALDWAVAKALGHQLARDALLDGSTMRGWWISGLAADPNKWMHLSNYPPSTNWSQGGPIVEKESISIVRQGDGPEWVASVYDYEADDWHLHTEGPTPLIAAMRCYVASKLGDEVDIPAELVK